ncbi:MAG: sulfatase-like hydrolase/transferase [Planctomycetota bacterium]
MLFLVDDMGLMDTSVPMLTDEHGKPQRHPLNDWYRTPNMERLAKQGVRFSSFYAHSLCSPSRISILTGKNSARHRNTRALHPFTRNAGPHTPKDWNWEGLKKGDMTLAGVLKDAGYTTIHVGKGHLGPVGYEGAEPLNLGFEVNVAGANVGAPRSYYGKKRYGLGLGKLGPHARPIPGLEKYHGTDTFLTEALTLEAKIEIDKALAKKGPFFLYMSHYAVHCPFNSDPRFAAHYRRAGKSGAAQAYATLVEGVDKSLGDLMDHLVEKGAAEDTFIVFLGDNGGDAPLGRHDDIASSAPLRGRKGTRWEGGVRVPFIAAWAKLDTRNRWQKKLPIVPGGIRQEVGACFDLFPTILELVDVRAPAGEIVDGQSLAKLLAGEGDPQHRNTFLSHYPHLRGRGKGNDYVTSYRHGRIKVVYKYLDVTTPYELYDLESDPDESDNLAATQPETLTTMMRAMVRELESMHAQYPVKDGRPLRPAIP